MRILLTGISGLLGGELAGVLTDRGHAVVGLVRRNRAPLRNDGRPLGRVALVEGDVSRPLLGLGSAGAPAGLDLIIHCAGLTGFTAADHDYAAVNVGGTANVLALASQLRLPVLHVSTAYVCGERSGAIAEDQIGERFANGYESSKAAAEQLVNAARSTGLPIAVARPSIIVGRESDGVIRAFGSAYVLLRLMAAGRLTRLPVSDEASLDFVAIDDVARAIADIAERMDAAAGRNFHLTAEAPIAMRQIHAVLASYPGFRPPAFVTPALFDRVRLPPPEQRLHQTTVSLYSSYLARDPRFCADNTRALLGRGAPPVTPDFVRRLIDHAIRAGFIERPDRPRRSASA
jgi:nucleoside-diphosphate-sugar epimerase